MQTPAPRGDLVPSGILGLLGTRGPSSRVEIARLLGVSQATVTQVTKELIARRVVEELDSVPSNGGRPARLLGLVHSDGVALGAKVAADHVAIVSVELDGTVRSTVTEPFDTGHETPESLGRLLSRHAALIDGTLLGVGIGVPGAVDTQASGIVDAPTLGWSAAPIGPVLRTTLGAPVLVDNDVNTLAAAERLYGIGRDHSSYLVVTIGRGIGCGIVVDGAVYRGAFGGAGEIGHIPVSADGDRCGCGARGCLEAHIGSAGLVRSARRAGAIGRRGTGVTLLKAARAGDLAARELYRDAGALLGRTLAGIVHTLDPEVVVVMGEGVDAWTFWECGFEPALRRSLLPARRGLPVLVEPWSDDQWARGAASLVLSTPFDAAGNGGDQAQLVRARLQTAGVR